MNERILTCAECSDTPSEFLRTVILPPDPLPIANPRPEYYIQDDNPISVQGWEPLSLKMTPTESGNIGNLRNMDAAFNPPADKGSGISAYFDNTVALSDYYIGKNWSAQTGGPTVLPSEIAQLGIKYTISSFTAKAPSDQPFLASGNLVPMALQGWDGSSWDTLYLSTTAGTAGETAAATIASSLQTPYYGHRFIVLGDGSRLSIASLTMSAAGEGIRSSAPLTVPS